MLALGSACYMVALVARPGGDRACTATRTSPSAGSSAWSRSSLGTWLFSDDLFKRVEFGLLISSVAAMTTFAIVLRQRLAAGLEPDPDSMMDAITDMPIDS